MNVSHRCNITLPLTILASLLLASMSALGLNLNHQLGVGDRKIVGDHVAEQVMTRRRLGGRRLGGPGSTPPTCGSKCGWCAPCTPVHVPIHPGLCKLEYYPEAWRCKCADKLFMP